ncbi:hypothetical protein MRX96_006759 [Rhipicephalus microplus]
MVNTTKNI